MSALDVKLHTMCLIAAILMFALSAAPCSADPIPLVSAQEASSKSEDPETVVRELDKLRTKYTDSHPSVLKLRRRLEALGKETPSSPHPKPSAPVLSVEASSVARARTADAGSLPGEAPKAPEGKSLNAKLLSLPPNRWIKLHQASGEWRRSGHAGSVFDLRRGKLVVFGSDTHRMNWDNAVHTFDPYEMRWTSSYSPAPQSSYRRDNRGIAVAGVGLRQPWAMHTFDGILVDPSTDSLVVMSAPRHNRIKEQVRGAKNPIWSFDLKTGEWKDLPFEKGKYPIVFAAASAYDSARDVIVAYPSWGWGGIWELGPERRSWEIVAGPHHQIHHTMVYDTYRQKLVVFGDYKGSRDVWEYTPGPKAYDRGTWEKRTPAGDCPALESAPVAYDSENRRFIAIAAGDTTCLYEPKTNRFNRLDVETPKAGRMNYMLQYDPFHKVFLLVTGDQGAPPVVWAFKLDPNAIQAKS